MLCIFLVYAAHEAPPALLWGELPASPTSLGGAPEVTTRMSYSASSAQRGLTSPSGVSECSESTNVGLLTAGMDRSCEDTVSLSSHSTVSSFPGSRPSPGDERRSSSTPSGATDQHFDSTTDLKNQLLSLSHPLLSCLPLEHTIVADRRRVFHKTQLCRHLASGYCRNGLDCPFAHSETELRPAPHLSKTMMCPAVKAGGLCPRGKPHPGGHFAEGRLAKFPRAAVYKRPCSCCHLLVPVALRCGAWKACYKTCYCTFAHALLLLWLLLGLALQFWRGETARSRTAVTSCGARLITTRQTCVGRGFLGIV